MTSDISDLRRRIASEMRLSAAVVAVAVNAWAIVILLRYLPSLRLRLTPAEIAGVAGYVLSVALLETILMLLPLGIVALVLLGLKRFAPLAVYATAALLGLFVVYIPCEHGWPFAASCPTGWPYLGLGVTLGSVAIAALVLRRVPQWTRPIYSGLERLVTLAAVYLLIDLVGLLVVVGRSL